MEEFSSLVAEPELSLVELQSVSYRVLEDIVDCCEKNSIDYFLTYGTLLGAVRHEGYIPWDDDVDIMMPRKDYDRFQRLYAGKFRVFSSEDPNYPYNIMRVCDLNYPIFTENEASFGGGVFVDVFPIDYVGTSGIVVLAKGFLASVLSTLYFQGTRIKITRNLDEPHSKYLLRRLFHFCGKRIGTCNLRKLINFLIGTCPPDSQRCEDGKWACLAWMGAKPGRNVFLESEISEKVEVRFGRRLFKAPKGYQSVLTRLYGDFRKLPPLHMREPHHLFKAYKRL